MRTENEIKVFLRAFIQSWSSHKKYEKELTPEQFMDKYYDDVYEWVYTHE